MRSNQIKLETVNIGLRMTCNTCNPLSCRINQWIISSLSSVTVWFHSKVGLELDTINWSRTFKMNFSDPLPCWYMPGKGLTALPSLIMRVVLKTRLNIIKSKTYAIKLIVTSALDCHKAVVRIHELELCTSFTSIITCPHFVKILYM
jgi:hypothetical protein